MQCVPRRDVPSPASQFSSGVPLCRGPAEVRRVRRFVPVNVVPCILRGKLPRERVRWVWVQLFPLPAQRAPAAVPADQRGVPASAMFRAA